MYQNIFTSAVILMFEAVFLIILVAAAALSVYLRARSNLNRTKTDALILIPVREDDQQLELRVRACCHDELFSDETDSKRILLVINENCPNSFLAKELAQELKLVEVVHISALKDHLIRNYYS